jgi:hypothetical protein
VQRLQPDDVGMSVWSTYHQLPGRLSDRIKAVVDPGHHLRRGKSPGA